MSQLRARIRKARAIARATPRRIPSVTTAAARARVTRNPPRRAGRYFAITAPLKKVSPSPRIAQASPATASLTRPVDGSRPARRAVEDTTEELSGPRMGRIPEHGGGRSLVEDLTAVHEQDAIAGIPCEGHLVGHDDHGHAFFAQVAHDAQDAAHQLGVKGRGRLV